jgi:hypothetical protein
MQSPEQHCLARVSFSARFSASLNINKLVFTIFSGQLLCIITYLDFLIAKSVIAEMQKFKNSIRK